MKISKADYATLRVQSNMKKNLDTNILFVYENRRTKEYESKEVTFCLLILSILLVFYILKAIKNSKLRERYTFSI